MADSRSDFVRYEFRHVTKTNDVLDPKTSRSVTIDTQLDKVRAEQLAAKVLAANAGPVVFEVKLEGLLHFDQFKNGIPSYIPDFKKFGTDGRQMKVISFNCDLDENTTTIKIRG